MKPTPQDTAKEPVEYRKPPHQSVITGIDLSIDSNTQKLCETYNESSGTTRSVLYVLMIINIIAIIAVFNSDAKYNWTKERIFKYKQSIGTFNQQLSNIDHTPVKLRNVADSTALRDSVAYYTKLEESSIGSDISDYGIVKVDIIGINFDIYDMPSIVGLSIIVLMIVLRFTLVREINNLRIAFNSITERYPNDADRALFKDYIKTPANAAPPGALALPQNNDIDPVLTDINFVRRRYHYNFLSMNEVFNVPYLDTSKNDFQEKRLGRTINLRLFYFCYITYSYVMLNFFCNLPSIIAVRPRHTFFIGTVCLICYIWIANLCRSCSDQKVAITKVFKDFWTDGYTFDPAKQQLKVYTYVNKIFFPLLILGILYGIGKLYELYF